MDKKTILVVEDEKGMRESLQEILESSGYAVVTAEDGERALELVVSQKIDLVLLDIIVPRKYGFEVLKELKEIEKTKGIPVVLATNLSDPTDIQKALDYGATTYLVKANYSLGDIAAKVDEVIG